MQHNQKLSSRDIRDPEEGVGLQRQLSKLQASKSNTGIPRVITIRSNSNMNNQLDVEDEDHLHVDPKELSIMRQFQDQTSNSSLSYNPGPKI